MPTLKDDLIETLRFCYGEVASFPAPLPMDDAEAWYEEVVKILQKHPMDLLRLVQEAMGSPPPDPHIDSLTAETKPNQSATDYFEMDPQGEGW